MYEILGHFLYVCFQRQLKDVFDTPAIDKSKWSLVQGGSVQDPCSTLVEKTALVMNGLGMRQAVTVDMDLRDAKLVYHCKDLFVTCVLTNLCLGNVHMAEWSVLLTSDHEVLSSNPSGGRIQLMTMIITLPLSLY